MNILTKYYRAFKAVTEEIDKNVKFKITRGVSTRTRTVPDGDGAAKEVTDLFIPVRLWLPGGWMSFSNYDSVEYEIREKTSEAFAVVDYIRENLDARFKIQFDSVEYETREKPKKGKHQFIADHWAITFRMPCPPPILPTAYWEQVYKHLTDYKEDVFRNHNAFMDPKFAFGEQLITNAERFTSSWSNNVSFLKAKTGWYACSFRRASGQVVHCILRNPNRRRRTSFLLGRTLYAVKACLTTEVEE